MEKAYNIVTLGLVGITALSGIALSSSTAMADTNSNSATSTASVTVSETCSMTGTVNAPHTATVVNGTYTDNIGKTTLQAFCNDNAGFSIYAIGYTDDELGNNVMAGTNTGQDYAIATGTEQDGDDSNWAMKVTVADDGYDQGNLTIEDGFDDFSDVPDSYTKVASYPAITDQSLGVQLNTTYAVYVGPTQAADTYAGQVKYVLVHPSTISYMSTDAITAKFQAYPGDSIEFDDGSTENTVVFNYVYDDESGEYTFMVTEGEYKEPVGYKGVWVIPMPDGSGGYDMTTFEIQNGELEWIMGLETLGGESFLGMEIPIYHYSGPAIIYDGNGATAGDMSHVASRIEGDSVTLIAPNYKKNGYGFAGWSLDSTATVNSSDIIYGPNETVSISEFEGLFDEYDNVTLYAVWVPTAGTMQNFSCSNLDSYEVTALTDIRDNNVYTVGKLADGNCWMMENLRLDGNTTLTAQNTNNPRISSLGESSDYWCTWDDVSCVNQSYINTNNTNIGGYNSNDEKLIINYNDYPRAYSDKLQWYGYGNYYNWYAATAGNGTYEVEYSEAAGDICPKGWSLPISSTTGGQFGELDAENGGTGQMLHDGSENWRAYPNNSILSGYFNVYEGGNLYKPSEAGAWWSRTARNDINAYSLFYTFSSDGVSNFVRFDVADSKNEGDSVRCISLGS